MITKEQAHQLRELVIDIIEAKEDLAYQSYQGCSMTAMNTALSDDKAAFEAMENFIESITE